MEIALLALGLVLIVEGLVWALAPGVLDRMVDVLRNLDLAQRRLAGLAAIAGGLALVAAARALGAA